MAIEDNRIVLLEMENNWLDTSTAGSNHEFTATGATFNNVNPKIGNYAGSFDGVDDHIDTANHVDFHFGTGDFTYAFWVRFASFNADGFDTFVFKGTNTGPGTSPTILDYKNTTNELRLILESGTDSDIYAESWTPSLSVWYKLIFMRESDVLKMFVDGIQLGSGTAYIKSINTNGPLWFGRRPVNLDREFGGLADQLQIWSRALTSAEIFQVSNGEIFELAKRPIVRPVTKSVTKQLIEV